MKKWKLLSDKTIQSEKEVIEVLLNNRGITEDKKQSFFTPNLSDLTIESVGLDKRQINKTLKRIDKAIDNNEMIIIYGDYDVDGVCAAAILWETIHLFYKNVMPYIPHRVDEGYGLSVKGVENLIKKYPTAKLIITVDNGVVAYDGLEKAQSLGLDVIITDHHVIGETPISPYALVHTTRLCGAGIALLLAKEITYYKSQMSNKIENSNEETLNSQLSIFNSSHLELAALATICDLVPLKDANRIIVKFGIEKLHTTKRAGLLELFKVAGITKETIGVYEIGHIIGPRINAMGRLLHGIESLRLLCTKNTKKAQEYSIQLSDTNKIRQDLTQQTTQAAKDYFSNGGSKSRIVFVSHKDYNQGIIGLVASRLVEEYYLPSFVLSIGEEFSKGSARSISGVNVIELIRSVSHTLVQAGGHPMAAGFTVETKRLEEFKAALEQKALEVVTDDLLKRMLLIDLTLNPSLIKSELYEQLHKFSPFGMGNPEPTFLTKNFEILDFKACGKERNHLSLKLRSDMNFFSAIAFGFGELADKLSIGDEIDVVYTIAEDTWNGNKKLQLKVKDLKIAE